MPQITQTYEIKAPINSVWDALVNPRTIEAWGGGPDVVMDAQAGGKFSLWGGDIFGTNTLIEAPGRIEQDWFGGEWSKPSKVIFELSHKGLITTVVLTHNEIPEGEVDDFAQGWKDYYMGPLKELLENPNG
jgi:activator of HSP90 ATPase